ncbi:high affinity immunoglobulin gamma Fc receptor I-like [Cheilinus undulatus]|uniref:high affinity immunoglobulin gamma Fc receptor I-like n=1 Tax=Cheilinus undulatus TaxID=241271 RepID=UPI001BD4FD42|nr:high affinity immunoglobulin gamma Fc receptor I-like [Cheilinus undulatus]
MQLTSLCLALSCLRVRPDRSQFSRYDSVSLSCEDQLNSTGWKVKRNTSSAGVSSCTLGWGSILADSTCFIRNIYQSDGGVYWCESEDGERSVAVNITITDRTVILISPTLPVPEGAAVTLDCRAEINSSIQRFHFYKDGSPVSSSSTGEFTLHNISKSDEGLYKCSVSGGEESVSSWLAVHAVPAASCSASSFRLMCHLLVGTPYLLSTIILGLIYRERRRETLPVKERRVSKDVIMEIVV